MCIGAVSAVLVRFYEGLDREQRILTKKSVVGERQKIHKSVPQFNPNQYEH